MMEIGGMIPSFQKGGTKMEDIWTPEQKRMYYVYQQKQKNQLTVPGKVSSTSATLPTIQRTTNVGSFGGVDPSDLTQFVNLHKWYFQDPANPYQAGTFDIRNPAHVSDFQRRYDERHRQLFQAPYFDGTKKWRALDGKLGLYTLSAPVLDQPPAAPVHTGVHTPPPSKPSTPPDPPEVPSIDVQIDNNTKVPFRYLYPDMRRMISARMLPPDLTLPFIAESGYTYPTPMLEDWRAKAAARQAMTQTAGRTLANYGPTQGLAANLSFLNGEQGDQLIQDIAATEARNVATVNPFTLSQAEGVNQHMARSALNRTNRYQGLAIAKQNYRNALRKYVRDIDTADIEGWQNRSQMNMVNTTNPFYYMDPTTGRTVFKSGYNRLIKDMGSSGADAPDPLTFYPTYLSRAKAAGMDDTSAHRWALAQINGSGSPSRSMGSRSQMAQLLSLASNNYGGMFRRPSAADAYQDYDPSQE